MSADAVTKVAESLSELGLPSGQRERMSHIVLNAIDYDALKAERDRAKEAVRNLDKALRNAVKERGDALDERDRLRAEIEKPADVLNAHDAVTEEDAALWETSPGDALARTVGELLDDLSAAQRDMHVFARRVNDLEAERDRLRRERDDAHDDRIEAQNLGIDIEDVRRHRREARARAVLDPEHTQESR